VVTPDDGTPFNITAMTLRFTAKRSRTDADAQAVITKTVTGSGITITGGSAGKARILLAPGDTGSLGGSERLFYDVQLADGSTVYTLVSGRLLVLADISRTAP
jgi:hypothetical protein